MVLSLALLLLSAFVPAVIDAWRQEIQKQFGDSVSIVLVGTQMEGDPEGIELARKQLENNNFRQQFAFMQAAMISEHTAAGNRFVVLLNEAWKPSWQGFEEALLGHEVGHAWLRARRLPAPAYSGGALGCLAVHTGDAVHHVLIRAELDRRNIDHRAFLLKNLDASAEALEQQQAAADACAWARQAALWVDARLAFRSHPWPGRERYEAAAKKRFREAEPAVDRIVNLLSGVELNDPLVHRQALVDVFAVLRQLAEKQQAHTLQ